VGVVRTGWGAALSAVCLAGLGAAALWFGGPPPVQPASAPASAFSAERAAALVQRIAERPHHAGSADHDRVRDLLAAEFEKLGVAVERQAATVQVGTTAVRAARVENLVCRIPGTASTGAVLLVAHYDSVPAGPGASVRIRADPSVREKRTGVPRDFDLSSGALTRRGSIRSTERAPLGARSLFQGDVL